MKSKEIYQSIDQAKVKKLKGGDKIIANMKRVEKETKGFTVENPKFDVAMTKLYGLLKTKNPEVLKDVKVEEKVTEVKVPTTKAERKKKPAKKTKTVKKTVKKATGKKKNTKPTPTPSAPKTKKVPFSTRAKQLADKEGISFAEARKKLSKQIKDEEAKIEKNVKSDLDKLLAFVRSDKFEDGEKYPKTYGQQSAETSSLSSDAKRKAKPRGKRISKKGAVNQHGVSEGGNVYYEYRDNRSDRNSIKAPQGQYKYKGKTPPYLEAGGTLPTPFGQAGLVGETGAMNEMELFAMGGGLPQGVHQYYANTYNPAYPTPHGYAKGGEITKTGNKGSARWEMKITDGEGNTSSIYAEKKSDLLQYKKMYLAKGGMVEYAIFEDYDGNDIKKMKFPKPIMESKVVEPMGYSLADIDEDEDGVLYARFQQEDEFAKGGMLEIDTIYDNGGKSADRYTLIDEDGDMYGIGNSVNMYIGNRSEYPSDLSHLGKKVKYEDLDSDIQKEIDKRLDTSNFAKGGELSKEFKFDKNFVIYVPSTSNVGDTIPKAELDKRVDEVERFVANKFGGYTETETDGGYKSTSGKIIEEDIVKVSVFAKANDWKKNEKSVISKVRRWAKKWGQEAIGFEYEGDLYYVSDSKVMKNGGVIDAFNLQFIKDVPKTNLKVEKLNNKISYKKGGKIGFDALSKKVAKRYEGKAVPKKYQREYGKRYSKAEAQEVGDKVASKVYRQQLKNK